MRGESLAAAIGMTLWCAGAFASEAVVDDAQISPDFVPALRLRSSEAADTAKVYDHQELMCGLFGECPAPQRGVAQAERAAEPGKGITFQLRKPEKPSAPPVYSSLLPPKVAEGVAQLDPVIVEGERLSRWYGDLSLSRIERVLPCLGCKGTPKPLPAAVDVGVEMLFATLRGFFQQPRLRGEPNDEALNMAADGCADNGNIRCANRPELP